MDHSAGPLFADQRGKRVIFVAHCILNQNAKIDGCAHYPGAMRELARFLIESDLGIVQMPCPEMLCLGLDRQADVARPRTVESEDTRVGLRMTQPDTVAACLRWAGEVSFQVHEYQRNGFEVVGVLGINGSPTCGVETNWSDGAEQPEPGVFIRALLSSLDSVPFRGVRARDPNQALQAAADLTKVT